MIDPEYIKRKEQQFLVHSFLYYKLDESLICDSTYDFICKELLKYKTSDCLKYPSLLKGLDESGSGFYIREYPEEIITKAFHLLYDKKKSEGMKSDFSEFVRRHGFKLKE